MLDQLGRDASTRSRAAFELAIAEIAARADNSHTFLLAGAWTAKFNRVPVKFLQLGGRLFIAETPPEFAHLLHAEVTTLGPTPWSEARQMLRRYHGGLDSWREQFLYCLLESPELVHAAGLTSSPETLPVAGVLANGSAFRTALPARLDVPPLQGFEAAIPPARVIEIERARAIASEEDRPLHLRHPGDDFWLEWLPGDVAYLVIRSNRGKSRGLTLRQFAQSVAEQFKARTPRHVILDQRYNAGGDLSITRPLMQALPELVAPEGLIFALTAGRTLSAGIANLGYLKQAGADRVVIVGEPVADRLTYWCEGDGVELPSSDITLLFARERHSYLTGSAEPSTYEYLHRHPIQVDSLAPDHLVRYGYDDFRAGRDPVLAKVAELIDSHP